MSDWIDLDTIIRLGTTLWVQLFVIFGIAALIFYSEKLYNWLEFNYVYYGEGIFEEWYERKCTAPVKTISDEYVYPHPDIPIDRKEIGYITRITPLEQWLLSTPIDYSIFWEYQIDVEEAKIALSKVLSKVPIIGGKFCKIDANTVGVDHSDPKIRFVYNLTDQIPSTKDEDSEKNYYYSRYTNGANHKFPFPNQEAVFKVTLVHYPNPNFNNSATENNNNDKYHTLLAIGCSHSICDGNAFFLLLRCWAAELNKQLYKVPPFNRTKLFIKPNELKLFKEDSVILSKHFNYSVQPTSYFYDGYKKYPSRRWKVKSWLWTNDQINLIKKSLLTNGKASEKLKNMIISTNDIITALYWKIRATLNNNYPLDDPILCVMVIDSRKWLSYRYPDGDNYFGNALGFLILHKTRRELINSDFSEIVLAVREAVSNLKKEDFEDELHMYTHIANEGVDILHRYHAKWCVSGYGYDKGKYNIDRDMMISNLSKLPTFNINFGRGNPYKVRFNNQEHDAQLGYLFLYKNNSDILEYYTSMPVEDEKFYNDVNIHDPNLNWDYINNKYVKELPHRWFFSYPPPRLPIIDMSAIFSNDRHRKVITL